MAKPDPAKNGPGSKPGNFRPIALPIKLEHNPVVLAEQARRASDIQLRIADWITSFAGSMNFVYLHVVLFTVWILFIERSPWPTLTLIVSLEAIFLRHDTGLAWSRESTMLTGPGLAWRARACGYRPVGRRWPKPRQRPEPV